MIPIVRRLLSVFASFVVLFEGLLGFRVMMDMPRLVSHVACRGSALKQFLFGATGCNNVTVSRWKVGARNKQRDGF